MKLVFYKCENSQGYDKNKFKGRTYNDALADLAMLEDDELRIFDIEDKARLKKFVDSYNADEITLLWWCAVLP